MGNLTGRVFFLGSLRVEGSCKSDGGRNFLEVVEKV